MFRNILYDRFPPKAYPQVNIEQPPPVQIVQLPLNVSGVEITVCAIESANRLFVQLIRNRRVLEAIEESLTQLYGPDSIINAPPLDLICPGTICISVQDSVAYRVLVIGPTAPDQVKIKYVDAGGYGAVHTSTLKQIRSDMLSYPLQAVEVILANIEPFNGIAFTPEAISATHQFILSVHTDGRLFARVVNYENDVACVDLIGHMRDQSMMSLGEFLVQEGHARLIGIWEQPSQNGQETAFSPADFPQLNATHHNGEW